MSFNFLDAPWMPGFERRRPELAGSGMAGLGVRNVQAHLRAGLEGIRRFSNRNDSSGERSVRFGLLGRESRCRDDGGIDGSGLEPGFARSGD